VAEEIDHLRRRLAIEGEKIASFFESLGAEDWGRQVYTRGPQWAVRQILAHFVSAERAYLHYMRDLLGGGTGVPRDFDIDAFNETQVRALNTLSPEDLVRALRRARSETVAFVGGLSAADLAQRGYHPWFGDTDLGFMLKLAYRHPMLHVRDIRQALQTGAPVPHGEGYASFARDGVRPEGS
jgi:uncharacterized damage-inducible protein DinB